MPIVTAEALSLGYGRRQVFDEVSFEFGEGVTALLGPNGAGKTTLLNAAATLHAPQGGRLSVLGRDVSKEHDRAALRRETSYLPQRVGYHPGFRVLDYVEYMGWLKGLGGNELSLRAALAVESVGLTASARARLRTLSGGMLRRAAIAGALVSSPQLLLLDEPTAGLDPEQRLSLRTVIRDFAKESSVVLSTHLIEDAISICDQVVVLNEGAIIFQGPASALEDLAQDTPIKSTRAEAGYLSVFGGPRPESKAAQPQQRKAPQ